MRTSNGKGSGVPSQVGMSEEEKSVEKDLIPTIQEDEDIEEPTEDLAEETPKDSECGEGVEEEISEDELFDSLYSEGDQSLPDEFQEVNKILDNYFVLQTEREIERRARERAWELKQQEALRDELESLNKKEEIKDNPEETEDEDEEGDDPFEEESEEKMSTKKKVAIGSSILILLCAMGVGLFFFLNSGASTASELQTKVNRLYTSKAKSDIKNSVDEESLQNYYASLEALDSKERKTDTAVSIEQELDTIGYFISDKATLKEFDKDSYDLSSASLPENLSKIRSNTANYTVSGLAITVNDLCTKVESDLNAYISIRDELNAITDVNVFIPENYKARVDAIKHTPNKTEVKNRYDSLVADKAVATAKSEAEKAAAEKLQKETEEAKQKAEEESNKLKQQLQDAQEELKNKSQSVKDGLNNIINGDDSEEYEYSDEEGYTYEEQYYEEY